MVTGYIFCYTLLFFHPCVLRQSILGSSSYIEALMHFCPTMCTTCQLNSALAHLVLGRDTQLHDEEFELAIFPAEEHTMHMTSTSHNIMIQCSACSNGHSI